MIEQTMNSPIARKLKKMAIRSGLARFDPTVRARAGLDYNYLTTYSSDIISAPIDSIEALGELEAMAHQAGHPHDTDDARKFIDLSQGMPDFSEIYSFDSILSQATGSWFNRPTVSRYPPAFGTIEARDAAAGKIFRTTGISYDPDSEILICNGASQAIAHALESFADPGEPVAVIDPCYMFYHWLAATRGLRIIPIPKYRNDEAASNLSSSNAESRESGVTRRIDRDAAAKAMRKAKVLILNSPANPDGSMIHEDDLAMLAELAQRHNVIIISDEVYADFCWTNPFKSIASLATAKPRTIVVSSVSKSHGLPGLRAGWAAGPASLIRPMAMLMAIRVPCVHGPTQALIPQLLNLESTFAAKRQFVFENRRKCAIGAVHGAGFCATMPDGAFYLWVDVPKPFTGSQQFAQWAAKEAAVAIIPGSVFGPAGKSKIRLSWGCDTNTFQEGITRLREQIGT